MRITATACALLAVISFGGGCRATAGKGRQPSVGHENFPLIPSSRLLVGRILAVDPPRGFAFVDLASDAPPAALTAGTELITRSADLQETGRLRVSRYVRGRTLGTRIIAGQPSPGNEVVWPAP